MPRGTPRVSMLAKLTWMDVIALSSGADTPMSLRCDNLAVPSEHGAVAAAASR